MRALIVKDPWATEIVEGKKLIEYRSRPTNIRERIGIIKAGSKTIIGEVNIINCLPINTYGEYTWVFQNPTRYKKPKPYKHPKGAQIWVNL